MKADLAEECRHLLAQSFTDDYFEVNTTLPSYVRWYEKTRHPASYQRHRALVKLIGSTSPEKRWILKYPVHMKHLADLLEVYPDACVMWTHRDPSKVLASYIDLIAGFRALFERDIDRAAIAREQVEAWASGAERAIEVRKQHDASQFLDLHFGTSSPIRSPPCAGSTTASTSRSRKTPRSGCARGWRRRPKASAAGSTRWKTSASPARRSSTASAHTCGTSACKRSSFFRR